MHKRQLYIKAIGGGKSKITSVNYLLYRKGRSALLIKTMLAVLFVFISVSCSTDDPLDTSDADATQWANNATTADEDSANLEISITGDTWKDSVYIDLNKRK